MDKISEEHKKLFNALSRANENASKKRNSYNFIDNPNKYIKAIYSKEDKGLTQEDICSRLKKEFDIDSNISKVYFDILMPEAGKRECMDKLPRGDSINPDNLYRRLLQAQPVLDIHQAKKGTTYSLKR